MKRLATLLALSLVTTVAATARAQAEAVTVCNKAFAEAQTNEKQGKSAGAQTSFEACAVPACPRALREECSAAVVRLSGRFARIVLTLGPDAGVTLRDLRVELDRKPNDAIAGVMSVEPGPHEVLVVHPDGRRASFTVEQLGPGEEKRLRVDLGPPPLPTAPPAAEPKLGPRDDRETDPPRIEPRRWPFFTGLGLAVAGGVGTGVFAVLRSTEHDRLTDSCAPGCTGDELSAYRRNGTLTTVSLVTAVVGLGVATTFYVLDKPFRSAGSTWRGAVTF